MARKFLTSLDLSKNELLNAKIQNLAADPASPTPGQIYYNSVANEIRVYNGTIWEAVSLNGVTVSAAEINFLSGVTSNVQNQIDTKAPINNPVFTGTVTLPGAPTQDLHAATKLYVDSTAQGLDVKQSVRAATTTAGTLASSFANGSIIDGVTLVTGDRILIKNQGTGSENGIYTVNASGAPTRAADANVSSEVTAGMFAFVSEGTINGNTGWVLTTDDTITLGTTPLVFSQFSGAGTFIAGNGLTQSGMTFNVGAGLGILSNSDDVAIDTSLVVRKFAQTLSTSATSYVITHNLNNQDVVVRVYDIVDTPYFAEVEVDVEHTSANTITLRFSVAPTANQYRVIVQG